MPAMQPSQPQQPAQMGGMSSGMTSGMGAPNAMPTERTYKVKAGDSLSAIAARYDTTVHALAAVNNIGNVNILYVGQLLQIP